jgi:hypothetical protein
MDGQLQQRISTAQVAHEIDAEQVVESRKGRLNVAQDAVLGKLSHIGVVSKGRLKACR